MIYKYLSMLCTIAGIFLLIIIDTVWALPVMVLGVIFSVVNIKKGYYMIGMISLAVSSVFLVVNAIVLAIILAGELYIELFY